jgi:hypothetical protein
MMQKHEERLVKYVVGDVDKEVAMTPRNYIECQLILAPHDETTSQANDGHDMGWVLDLSGDTGGSADESEYPRERLE